jgi:hypothetical protein
MKVKVVIEKTIKGLQAYVVQEGKRGAELIKRRNNNVGAVKTHVLCLLRGCEVEFELGEGVE